MEEAAIIRLIQASAYYLDERKVEAFLDLFSEESEYLIVVQAPELKSLMTWMQATKAELAERFEAAVDHEWEIAQVEQTRLVTVGMLNIKGESATSSSSLAVFNTDTAGNSYTYAVGRYEDVWQKDDQSWLLKQRKVVLKTRILKMPSPLPL